MRGFLVLFTTICVVIAFSAQGYRISRNGRLSKKTSSRGLEDAASVAGSREFSYSKLPTPLKSTSQSAALKLLSIVQKVNSIAETQPVNEVLKVKGISEEKWKAISSKADRVEEMLLKGNLRLVHSIAVQYQNMGLELDDLVFEGVKGLKKAISKFDPSKGFAFSTYAYPWIREYIKSALASSLPVTLPRHVYRLLVKVKNIQEKFITSGKGVPTDEMLAEEMGISMDRFEVVRKAMVYADRMNNQTPAMGEMPGGRIGGRIQFDEATWERVKDAGAEGSVVEHLKSQQIQPELHTGWMQQELRTAILKAVSTLPVEEARVIDERLGLSSGTGPVRYEEMRTSLGFDSETAKHLYYKGLRRLKRRAADPNAKYPELQSLQMLFNELEEESVIVSDDQVGV